MLLRCFYLATLLFAWNTRCYSLARRTQPPDFSNSSTPTTTSAYSSITSPICCYIDDPYIAVQVWWQSSINATVATVYTNIYQYDNTVITNYTTVPSNYTYTTTLINGPWGGYMPGYPTQTISGVPTDIIEPDYNAVYEGQFSRLQYGTAVTDPYGNVIQSPTPWAWFGADAANTDAQGAIGYQTLPGFYNGDQTTSLSCPPPPTAGANELGEIQPSTDFFVPLASISVYGGIDWMPNDLEFPMPSTVIDYLTAHIPPGAPSFWSNVGICTPGSMEGQPTAHIPVATLTAQVVNTFAVGGMYMDGTSSSTTSPSSTTPTTTSTTSSSTSPYGGGNTGGGDSSNTSNGYGSLTDGSSGKIYTTSAMESEGTNISKTGSGGSDDSSISYVITVGSSTVTADDSTKFSFGSQTLTAGGTITLKGNDGASDTTIYLQPSATGVVVNGATEAFEAVVTNAPPTPLIFGSETFSYSVIASADLVIGGQTLTAGGVITTAGETLSLLPGGSQVVIASGDSTTTENYQAGATTGLSIGTRTFSYSVVTSSGVVIGSQTLTPGGVITVGGETLSLLPGGSGVVIASGTSATTESIVALRTGAGSSAAATTKAKHNDASSQLNVLSNGVLLSIGSIVLLLL